ncbi:MAG: hypothetical protein Q9175_005074 [Cornicularia normoerica]
MSPQAPRKAMSPLFSPIFIDKQQNAGLFRLVGEGISSASPTVLIDQQTAGPSSVVEEAMSAACPAALINQQQTAGPSTAVEDQLRKQIARLEDDIRQLKLDQDPNRKAITHTLLQEKLAQLRKKNLNLRVELQVAQERLRLLEEKQENHHALERKHKRCKKLMQQAIENLSTGLDLPNGESVNLGLNIEAVVPGGSLLPPQTGSSPPVDEPVLPPVLSRLVRTLTLPVSLLAAQVEAQLPTMPIFSASLRLSQVNEPAPRFGDPEQSIQLDYGGYIVLFSTPGFYNSEQQSFEEAKLRRYEHYDGKLEPTARPKGAEAFGG